EPFAERQRWKILSYSPIWTISRHRQPATIPRTHPGRAQTACRMDIFSQAQNLGILTEFTDGQGKRHVTDEAALKIIVDAFPPCTPRRLVDGPVVIRTGLPARTELGESARLPVRWTIEARQSPVAQGATNDRSLVWPEDLAAGTYRLQLTDAGGDSEEVPLIVARAGLCRRFRSRLGDRRAALWCPLGAQLGHGGFHRSGRPDPAGAPAWGRR